MIRLDAILWHLRRPRDLPAIVWKNIVLTFSSAGAAARAATRAGRRWDRALGVDTVGLIAGARLGLAKTGGYGGIPPLIAEHLLAKVIDRTTGFDFLDMGCGKGRMLLIAARYPFARVIGVELNPALYTIACSNVEKVRKRNTNLAPIEIVNTDATVYPLPPGPFVLFLYNPFVDDVMTQVARRLTESMKSNPRKVFIIYFAPAQFSFFDDPLFKKQEVHDLPNDPMDLLAHERFVARIYETRS